MIKIAFEFDLERATEMGDDVSDFFPVDGEGGPGPLGAVVVGNCPTTWCYPNCREIHLTFRDEDTAIEWMIAEGMDSDEIDFHFTQQVEAQHVGG